MNAEKICQNCKNQFTIEPDDFGFYEKIQVPTPTFCPDCRRQRRLSWRNDFYFYSRTCDLCKKAIISLYSPDKPLAVYCVKCWWSDKWDPKEYAQDVNFSRPFFEQFQELQKRVPRPALVNDDGIASLNCEYTHDFSFGKNCYMVLIAWKLEDCLYSVYVVDAKEIVDCFSAFGNNQLVYEGIFLEKCYECRYVYYSASLINCAFCYDCRDCSDCFLSVGLRHKKYCIKNKQYSKEEYEKILARYRLDTYTGVERAKREFYPILKRFPRKFSNIKHSLNSIGDDLINCKNVCFGFNMRNAEDCRYISDQDTPKDSYDISVGGEHNQCYEGLTPDNSYRGLFTIFSWKNSEVTYCENCHSSKKLFGCSGLKKGEYSILNKQYSKEEYEKTKTKLIEHMKETGEWGEFFPSRLSHFGYNETVAQDFYPLLREQASQKGFKWQDYSQFTVGKETMKAQDVPDSINDIPDSITSEVFACITCKRNYRVVSQELNFYRKMKIPIPRQCFYCRHRARFAFRNPYRLWHRRCVCAGSQSENGAYQNTVSHFHTNAHCPNEFETSYASDRPEIVYCEQCYQAEVA